MTFRYRKYSDKYESLFEAMKKKILAELKHKVVVEHIGSTAVPGLGGKGIIDISIGIKKWSEADGILKILRKIGFKHFHNIENCSLFISTKAKCEEGDYHIHISRIGTKRYSSTIAFRDFLRNHPDEANKYDKLKNDLFEKCQDDRQLYKIMKRKYFDELIARHKNLA